MKVKIKSPKLDLTPSTWDKSPWKPDLSQLDDSVSKRPETIAAITKRVKFPFKVRKVALNYSGPQTDSTLKVGTILTITFVVTTKNFGEVFCSSDLEGNWGLADSPSWEHVP